MKWFLEKGADPKIIDNDGDTLMLFALEGGGEVISLLLAEGVDINQANAQTGEFPLLAAAKGGKALSVEFLLQNGAEPWKEDEVNGGTSCDAAYDAKESGECNDVEAMDEIIRLFDRLM